MELIELNEIYKRFFDGGHGIERIHISDIDAIPTIDPIRAAGGCYCRECKHYKDGICTMYKNSWGGPLEMGEHDFCSNCEPREAHTDG